MRTGFRRVLVVFLILGFLLSEILSVTVFAKQEQETGQLDKNNNLDMQFAVEDEGLDSEPPEGENEIEQKDGNEDLGEDISDADNDSIDGDDFDLVPENGLQPGEDYEDDELIDKSDEWENVSPEDIVSSENELYEWFESHQETGGDVYLGDNITISTYASPCYARYTIHTGRFGITYDGSIIALSDFEIIGEGVDVPVVCVKKTANWWPNWNRDSYCLNITATGRDGIGGTALLIAEDDGSFFDSRLAINSGLIRSYGRGAIGIEFAVPLYAYCFTVIVEGENSTAVYAPQGLHIFYSKLRATGPGATAVSGGNFVLNTCLALPTPENAEIINRSIYDDVGNGLYIPVPLNEDLDYYNYYFPFRLNFLLDEGDGYGVIRPFQLFWGPDGEDILKKYVNTKVLGQTKIIGNLEPFFDDFLITDDFPIELVVDVRDPSVPCIAFTAIGDSFDDNDQVNGKEIKLGFWELPNDISLSLMRSEDMGKTWLDVSHSPNVKWGRYDVGIFQHEINSTLLFRLDSTEKGKSNIVTINPYDIYSSGGWDGDRDGGDRIPLPVKPTPGDDPEGDNPGGDETEPNPVDKPGNVSNRRIREKDKAVPLSFPIPNETIEDIFISENPEATLTEDTVSLVPDGDDTSASVTEILENFPNQIESEQNSSDKKQVTQIIKTHLPREWEDESTIAVSGRRLAAMLDANPENITFIKQGIRLTLSSFALRSLELSENQLFSVKVEKLPEYTFSVLLTVDEMLIFDLPFKAYIDEKVFLDLSLISAVCKNEQGKTMLSAYDPILKQLSVSLPGSGLFTLVQHTASVTSSPEQTNSTAVLPPDRNIPSRTPVFTGEMIGIGICAFIFAVALIIRKRIIIKKG